MNIRDANKQDFNRILQLNDIEVKVTSPLSLNVLADLHEMAKYHKVFEVDGKVTAFILVIDNGKTYQSENYQSFNQKYDRFLYIDRIVVDKTYSGLKIGSKLYQNLFEFANQYHYPIIACEYNVVPLNKGSQLFHNKFGFKEIGQQWLNNNEKRVSLQIANAGKN